MPIKKFHNIILILLLENILANLTKILDKENLLKISYSETHFEAHSLYFIFIEYKCFYLSLIKKNLI